MTHPLKQYLDKYNITVPTFAAMIGVKKNAVYQYIRGLHPGTKTMQKILQVTGGELQPNHFYIINN